MPWAKAQRRPKCEARSQVGSAPMGAAIALDGRDGGGEAAVRVRGARPDVALVEMSVDVDQPRPDLTAVLAERSALRLHFGCRRVEPGNPPVRDRDVDECQPLPHIREPAVQQAARHSRVGDPEPLHPASSLD